ncbi:tetratricopeptide repeat protein [Paraburkholderia bonniea]|uniref:tetratricopeptide repeat protein n=1 Tax=Paraburkholderia bonniea TaxID=2152891 RepID=UPI0012916C14|nr:tetratricopeptide repeat protein [Paraburkholderia bonniea]WJF91052.1 tetratricopeptide repeat protein [Paraburkholderia bonniea]WJF94366.1 tetratricopeptide repeat protein [Paraburkholderia bonniea]
MDFSLLPDPPFDHPDSTPLLACADAQYASGQISEAIQLYEHVLAQQPGHPDVLHRLGLASLDAQQPEQARHYLDLALSAAPARTRIWEQRVQLEAIAERHAATQALGQLALDVVGSTAILHQTLGDSFRYTDQLEQAQQHYRQALELDASLYPAAFGLGTVHAALQQPDQAAPYFESVWQAEPSHLPAGLAWLSALTALNKPVSGLIAAICQRFATDAPALQQLAFRLNHLQHFNEALSVSQQGLALDPENGWLHHNACYAQNLLGLFDAARLSSAAAARLLPTDPPAQFNLAITQLRHGDFAQGWKQYIWHERLSENHDLARPAWPEWQGEAVAGCRFLLVGEQGLGDQLQFLRTAIWLRQQGAQADVWISSPLVELASYAEGVHAAWKYRPPGPYDYWCRITRMPEHMQLDLAMLATMPPYLKAPVEQIERWQQKLSVIAPAAPGTKRVGLVWAGNPDYELDRYRSIPLPLLAPILALPGVTWCAVQKDATEQAFADLPASAHMPLLGPHIETFDDTLALLQSVDLLLTIDSAVAHLAGASGRPVWIMLPTCTDWRWMTERSDSPWYPSARLFRQRELGDWSTVLQEVETALQAWLEPTGS